MSKLNIFGRMRNSVFYNKHKFKKNKIIKDSRKLIHTYCNAIYCSVALFNSTSPFLIRIIIVKGR